MMRSPLFLAFALAIGTSGSLLSTDAAAQSTRAVRATAEASMVLTGNIDVAADGAVTGLVLDQRASIAPAIAAFVDGTIRKWQFEPTLVDGKPVAKHAPLRVRLLGRPGADGNTEVRMTSVDFSEYDDKATDAVTAEQMRPPRYPEAAFRVGAQGEVMLLVKVERDGAVADVVAEQVNMGVVAPEHAMKKMRDMLAKASISEARKWTFTPPTSGEDKGLAFWTVRVPVTFALSEKGSRQPPSPYGRWQAYIPGPRQQAPWRTTDDAAQVGSDLLPAGGVYMVDAAHRGLRLLTPLGQG
ncbi:energy transducer TonB [Stenotrophomonas sp. Br8]|uniref:energy transducer TonB n=1 Tax=Stenotrophomonas sp. Br8 TaxID=2759658 RepID=UPI00168A6C27|nr:energy transducer TonB [Stenotrophomonas sp. Br8]MBD3681363.1 energy transducer TonB [Stenotrophomonas sp. Br8]